MATGSFLQLRRMGHSGPVLAVWAKQVLVEKSVGNNHREAKQGTELLPACFVSQFQAFAFVFINLANRNSRLCQLRSMRVAAPGRRVPTSQMSLET